MSSFSVIGAAAAVEEVVSTGEKEEVAEVVEVAVAAEVAVVTVVSTGAGLLG